MLNYLADLRDTWVIHVSLRSAEYSRGYSFSKGSADKVLKFSHDSSVLVMDSEFLPVMRANTMHFLCLK